MSDDRMFNQMSRNGRFSVYLWMDGPLKSAIFQDAQRNGVSQSSVVRSALMNYYGVPPRLREAQKNVERLSMKLEALLKVEDKLRLSTLERVSSLRRYIDRRKSNVELSHRFPERLEREKERLEGLYQKHAARYWLEFSDAVSLHEQKREALLGQIREERSVRDSLAGAFEKEMLARPVFPSLPLGGEAKRGVRDGDGDSMF